VNPNERVLGALNPVLVEPSTPAEGWKYKTGGIPTDKYVNIFDGAGEDNEDEEYVAADASIYVIPTGEKMTINMLYDIQTADKRLGNYLSDGKTKGFRVANAITNTLENITIEAGKAYTIKIVVGLESVKVTATIKDWGDSEEAVVNMPENPTITANQALGNALEYQYDPAYTYTGEMALDGNTINYTISQTAAQQNPAIIMNDMARILGALYRANNGAITSLSYNDQTYTWDEDLKQEDGITPIKGSRWTDGTNTLVKVLTDAFGANQLGMPPSVTLGTNLGENLIFNVIFSQP
jgi:hypothetical protein